ncbi:radical SAM protein [Clostridium chromiireducens]|uniref:Radical SAM protein n=1 Tax=Clostridium chromiireducens TaxID=225345 RepID=A0A1V4IXZ7_9CLOT|nr:radical SAM protein [Clostridium chromiireducens]OPJ64928.1 radical SAM superfamily protein [Clostridium chromiireducens]RII31988.1 radical SAM protein [Clostridium chromiireducens]
MNYLSLLDECTLCSRNCKVNRNNSEIGFCRASNKVKIARASLHLWEEPPISQGKGSGTVFFSHCNLKCVFCQNYNISQGIECNLDIQPPNSNPLVTGIEVSIDRLSEIFLELQEKGANNINLVTPTHFVPQIIDSLKIAKKNGLIIPILYNTNSYDSIETIKLLDGYIDVYLPDFKYFNDKYAKKYSNVDNYADNTIQIISEMVSQVGIPKFDSKGNMIKGVIVRHLMLPGLLFDSKKIIDFLYNRYKDDIYISLMNQYIPMFKAHNFPEINRPLNSKHYDSLINYALELGIKNGFIQDEGTNTSDFIPEFNLDGVKK